MAVAVRYKEMLYIITGLPYTGKTTLTQELVRRFGFTTISVDEFIDRGSYVVERMTQADWDRVYTQAFRGLRNYLLRGKTVVFDGGSLKRSERDTLKRIAEKAGTLAKLIYINTPRNVIKRRWLENRTSKVRDHVKETTMDKALDMFEEPQREENPILYNQDTDLGSWIKRNVI